MDNLTHSLVGLAAAKAGCEKLSPGATALCLLAASAPDADIVVLAFGDRWTFLHYHRHITHSILGVLIIALLLPLLFWMGDRLLAKLRSHPPRVRLKGLIIASLIVSATHPFLDWTNNYGVRLFLPWSSQWSYGDLVFIVDPFIWLVMGGAAFLLTSDRKLKLGFWLFLVSVLTYFVMSTSADRGLSHAALLKAIWIIVIASLVIVRRLRLADKWGAKVAWAAFSLLVLYWIGLAVMHSIALREVHLAAAAIARSNSETVTDQAAMPTLANPFRWLAVVETERASYRFELSVADGTTEPAGLVRHDRADYSDSPFTKEAVQDRRAQIFLGFARFPVFKVSGSDCLTDSVVQLADLRYTQPGGSRGSFALEVPVECPSGLDPARR